MKQYKQTISIIQRNSLNLEVKYEGKNLLNSEVNIIVKNKNDTSNNDKKSLVDKTYIIENEDAINGIFYINLTSEETNLDYTINNSREYIIQVEIKKDGDFETIIQSNFLILENFKKESY